MLVLFLGIVIGNSAKSVKCNRQPRREFEVYAWPLNRDPHLYPLENITTIAQWKGSKNNHFFHENGIRVEFCIGNPPIDFVDLNNATYRKGIVDYIVKNVDEDCFDGAVFDAEGPVFDEETKEAYVSLIKETREALLEIGPDISLSMAVPFDPKPLACLSGRCKLWDKMAEHMDTLFIMGYDSQDNIITASASSPLNVITTGVENYLKMGIPKEKLVLGVHWASYRYPCVYMNRHDDPIPPCVVDFAHRLIDSLSNTLHNCSTNAFDGVNYDNDSHTVYCSTREDGHYRQRWFDTPDTLAEKYKMAISHGLVGLGMWSCDLIDYPLSSNPLSKKYWDQIAAYAKQMSKVNK